MTQNGHVVGERLIGYLYDEVDAGERATVAAHLSTCAACASELAGLGATRQRLAGWAPPEVALGFQITRATASTHEPAPAPSASVLRPPRWWRPLPAWAQAVAAAVIFAIGLAVGSSRTGDAAESVAPAETQVQADTPSAVPTTDSSASVTAPETAALAQQIAELRAEVATLRSASLTSRASAGAPSDARLEEIIAASEANMRTELSLRLTQLARDVELARRSDRDEWNRTFNVTNQQTGAVMRQQRQDIEGLAKVVSQSVSPR